ncbi:MAG: hypothetical protein H6548_02000 [Chitinophagales bacterium]|nr:hypothetical protein [Chitinophagales bacterium]HRX23324.1 hypothetical protein [Chitinophagales bacterium]
MKIIKQIIYRMKSILKNLEGTGLIFILFSFGWQMFETDLSNQSTYLNNYHIHKKLDKIYMITADLYSQSKLNHSGTYTSADFSDIVNNWEYFDEPGKEIESVNRQLDWTFFFRSLLYIVGSLMLIISKFKSK